MSKRVIKEYRLTEDEASKLDTWHIINAVIFRVADDAPSLTDSDAMEDFFDSILSVQAAVFSAWFSASFAVVGGMWHIFRCCCAPMVSKAIEGYDLLYEPGAAKALRLACMQFPGGIVPRNYEEVESFLESDEEEDFEFEAVFEDAKKVQAFFDFERFYRVHRDCFVIPKA